MLYRSIIAVCSDNHAKHINAFCRHSAEFFNVKLADIGSILVSRFKQSLLMAVITLKH